MTKIEGLVLQTIDVKDSDIMVHLLTPEEGVCSIYYRGVRKAKAKIKKATFTPLALIDAEVQKTKFSDVLSGKDAKRIDAQAFAINDFSKTAQLMFMAECVQRVSKPGQVDNLFYEWLKNHLQEFYLNPYNPSDIIYWLLAFIDHMGIGVDYRNMPTDGVFSFDDGRFKPSNLVIGMTLSHTDSENLRNAFASNFERRIDRQIITKHLVAYLEYHFNIQKPLKSFSILREILDA